MGPGLSLPVWTDITDRMTLPIPWVHALFSPCIHPLSSMSVIHSGPTQFWVSGLLGLHIPAGRYWDAMNRHWLMLSAVSWALTRVAHVSVATAQCYGLASHCTDCTFRLPWKQGWAQLPMPWHPLIVFSNSDVFLSHPLSLPSCLYFSLLVFHFLCFSASCLYDLWCSVGLRLYSG